MKFKDDDFIANVTQHPKLVPIFLTSRILFLHLLLLDHSRHRVRPVNDKNMSEAMSVGKLRKNMNPFRKSFAERIAVVCTTERREEEEEEEEEDGLLFETHKIGGAKKKIKLEDLFVRREREHASPFFEKTPYQIGNK
ncbi:hypothetical protein V1478_011525 [Vespula squamosa]|uniref:Uncharacterized protein n=1 Tax=Vespula squamosa TaxID=30214 RepID=A0ABD2AFE1_VESSQ